MSAYARAFAQKYDIDTITEQLVDFYRARVDLVRRG
jgi:hypothetical protein